MRDSNDMTTFEIIEMLSFINNYKKYINPFTIGRFRGADFEKFLGGPELQLSLHVCVYAYVYIDIYVSNIQITKIFGGARPPQNYF